MSSSVSHLASPRMLQTLVLLTGILRPQLCAQQAPAAPSFSKAIPALTDSSEVSSGKTKPALTVSGNVSAKVISAKTEVAAQKKAQLQYLHLPLAFEKNQGQADSSVKFLSRGAGYGLFLTDREAVLSFGGQRPSSIKLRFLGANSQSTVEATDRLPGTSNYFLGNDRTKWHTNVPNFGKVEYKNLYSEINLVYYGNQQKIEHDFVVAPHADPTKIKFAIDGAKKLALEKSGDLVVTTVSGELRLRKPAIYQTVNGARQEIAGGYALKHGNEVSFALGVYDRDRELTIDPVLILSTYLADSNGVSATGVAVDGSGNIYVTGSTTSSPTTQLFGTTPTLTQNVTGRANGDVFVVKLNSAGNQLLYSALIGGAGLDNATSIAVDGSGNAYVGGFTQSSDFPASSGAYKTTLGSATQDAFFSILNPAGTALNYSTYFGGNGSANIVNGIAVNGGTFGAGVNVYISGTTDASTNALPSTANSFQPNISTSPDAFLARFNPVAGGLSDLIYSTYLGGTNSDFANGVAVNGPSKVFLVGTTTSADFPKSVGSAFGGTQDAFVGEFDTTSDPVPAGMASCNGAGTVTVTSSSFAFVPNETITVSGTGDSKFDALNATINTAAPGSSYKYASTGCTGGIVATNAIAGTATGGRVYATYLGGANSDSANAVAVDGSGNAFVTGQTASSGLATGTPFQSAISGTTDSFLAKFNPSGTLTYFSYLGGSGDEQGNAIAIDGGGNVFVGGFTTSADLPTKIALNGTQIGGQDGFVAKTNPVGAGATDLIYLTYLGGTGTDAVNALAFSSGPAVVAGSTNSSNLLTTANAFQPSATGSNAFVASLDAAPATTAALGFNPAPTISSALNTSPSPTSTTVRADLNTQDQLSYTYVIANGSATDAAHNAVFNDPLAGAVINSANFKLGGTAQTCPLTSPTNCSIGSAGTTCHLGTVDKTGSGNETATVCITATPNAAAPGTTISSANATVASAETTAVTAPTLTATVVLSTKITTSISQTTSANPLANNAPVTYTITLTNNGPNTIPSGKAQVQIVSAGTNATLTITSLVSSDGADTCVPATGTCTFTGAAFTASSARTITAMGNVKEISGHQETITVTATAAPVTPTDFTLDSGATPSANTVTTVQPVANLTTTVTNTTPGGATVTVANNTAGLVYTVNIHNTGDKITTGKLTGNLFSSGVSLNTVTPTVTSGTGTCGVDNTAHTYTCDNVTVDNGTDFTLTLTGTAIETTGKQQVLAVNAMIVPETPGDYGVAGGSTTTASNSNVTVQPKATLVTNVATAASAITANNTAGVQYTVSVQNQGPDSISTAHITGSLGDANVNLSGASTAGPCTIDNGGHTFDCTNVSIGNATTLTVTFTGTATETTGKQQLLTISASVSPQTAGDFAFGGSSMPSNSNSNVTVQPVADLGVNSITGPAMVNNNGTATYTFTVTDNGPDDVSTAQVKGSFSGSGVAFTSAAGTSAFCSFAGQNFTCNLPLLKGSGGTNRSSTITLQGPATETNGKQTTLLLGAVSGLNQIKVAPATAGDYSDGTPANDAAGGQPFSTNVVPVAKLVTAVVQTVPVSTTVANNTSGVKYQISINNQGPDDLTNLTLSGMFSSTGVSLNSASIVDGVGGPIPGCVVNNPAHSYSCTGINIANTATATFFLVGTVVETTGVNTPLTVTAGIAPGTVGDFTPGSGSLLNAQAITNVQPHANITTLFTTAPPPSFAFNPGSPSKTYIVRVTNGGPDTIAISLLKGTFTSSNVTVNITSVTPGSGSDSCAAPTGATYQCTLGTFTTGVPHSFTIIADVILNSGTTSGSVSNNITSVGQVSAGDFVNDDPQGGSSSAPSTVKGTANLAFNFFASSTTPKVGDTYTYTASVTNAAGASDAAGVNVTVNLFPGQTFLAFPASSANCSGTTTITCAMGTVAAGAPASVATIVVLASPALVPPSALGNPRQVVFSQGANVSVDTNQTVNIGASSAPAINLTARAAAHITVAHTNSSAPVLINGTGTSYPDVTYTTQVTNVPGPNGSSVAQNIVITDTPPAQANAALKSVLITGSGNFCDPPSGGQITCHISSLGSGGSETVSVTVTPVLSGNGLQTSITDVISYTSSDVVDPGPAGGTSDPSTIQVRNTVSGGVLPLTDGIRSVGLTFGTVSTTGVTNFNTSASFGTVNLPVGYPIGIQPAGALLYNFSTTATITTPTTFCINNSAQTFAKPERVRVFLVSTGAPLDITSSIIPGNPTTTTGVTMVCGRTGFSNGSLTLALLEPANNAPVLNASNASPVAPFPTQGVTGQVILDASSADDPDNNICNGSPISSPVICRDKDQLTYRWTTSNPLGFTNANKNPIGATLTSANPSNVFLPLGKNQTITLSVTDQLGVTTSNSFVRNIVNTPALSVADVLPVDGEIAGNATPIAIRFFNVAVEGVSRLTTQAAGSAPSGYRFGTNGVRYNISTDATINGNTQVCIDISNQRFVKPERVRILELSPTFADVTTSIAPVPTIPSKGQIVNQACGLLSGFSTGVVQVAAVEPVNNPPVIGLTFSLSNSQDAGKGVTGNFVDLNLVSSFDPDINPCNGNSSTCSDTPQLRFFVFGPFPGALQATSANPIVRNVSLPGGTTTVTVVAIDQTITVPANAVINVPSDIANLPGAAGQNGLTTTQFPVTIDSTTPGGGSTGNTATILAGQSASFIFTPVSPNGGVLQGSGTLNLTCANGPTTPSLDSLHITCGITPPTFTIGSSSALALLISTTGATLGKAQPATGAPLYAAWVAFAGMPFAGIVIISVSGQRRRWLKLLLALGLLVVAIGSQVACGGGGNMKPTTSFATPRGAYEIVVTGTQNGTALSKNSFTITVQ